MPAPVRYVPRPFVPDRYEPGGRLGDYMRRRGDMEADAIRRGGEISARLWSGVGQNIAGTLREIAMMPEIERRRRLEEAAALAQQRRQDEELQLRKAEIEARKSEREEARRLQSETIARSEANELGSELPPGPINEGQMATLSGSPATVGRTRYAFGPGTAQGPELLPTAAQTRQAAIDEQARAAAKQLQADREADNKRQQAQFEESKRHNQVVEARQPRQPAREIILGPNGPLLVDKETGKTERVIGPDGQPVKLTPSAQERIDARKFTKAAPVLKGISELSERINTLQGVYAKARGEIERQKAKINLNDDIAEYESLVSMFTPMVARALGHVGTLTEQDVQSVKDGFPKPGDSQTLRDRKINRLMSIISDLEGAEGVSGVVPPPTPQKKNPNR